MDTMNPIIMAITFLILSYLMKVTLSVFGYVTDYFSAMAVLVMVIYITYLLK